MTIATVESWTATLKDMYPLPGTRLKQWVVDMRREAQWERETCPFVVTDVHDDNTGAECRNAGGAPWMYLDHDCCDECADLYRVTSTRRDVVAWLAEKAKRPPICEDRTKFSDEVQPDYPAGPFLSMFKEKTP